MTAFSGIELRTIIHLNCNRLHCHQAFDIFYATRLALEDQNILLSIQFCDGNAVFLRNPLELLMVKGIDLQARTFVLPRSSTFTASMPAF
jgi:hypothetical protein